MGVGQVCRLVGLDEGRLLQGEEGADGQERDDDPDQPDDVGRDAPTRRRTGLLDGVVLDRDLLAECRHAEMASRTSAT